MLKKALETCLLALACSGSFAADNGGPNKDAQIARDAINAASDFGKKALDVSEDVIGRSAGVMSELYPGLVNKDSAAKFNVKLSEVFVVLKTGIDRVKPEPESSAQSGETKN